MLSRRAPPLCMRESMIPNTLHFPGSTCWQVTNVCKFSANSHFSRLSSFSLFLRLSSCFLFTPELTLCTTAWHMTREFPGPICYKRPCRASGGERKEKSAFNCLSRRASARGGEGVSTDDREKESRAKIETPFLIKEITRAADERRKTSGRWGEKEFAFNSAKRVENFHFLSF